jgi:nucleotide-binding universal stress UspA family protein
MTESVILVGVDGSEGSIRALHWAVDEARLRRCPVEVVTVWPLRDMSTAGQTETAGAQRRAEEVQRSVLAHVLSEIQSPPVISTEIVHGDVVDVLLRMSTHASLLVIGSHGTSSMRHATLGSVSEACASLMECPTVVVPAPAPQHHDKLDVRSRRRTRR